MRSCRRRAMTRQRRWAIRRGLSARRRRRSMRRWRCVLGDVVANGGAPGNPPPNNPGLGGTVTLLDCIAGAIHADGGSGAFGSSPGGTVTLTRCVYTSVSVNPGGTFNDTPTAPGSGDEPGRAGRRARRSSPRVSPNKNATGTPPFFRKIPPAGLRSPAGPRPTLSL